MAGRHRDHRLDLAIAAAGSKVLRTSGYQAFSIDHVAKELAIPRSTIYARWRNKSDLLDALLSRRFSAEPATGGAVHAALVDLLTQDLVLASEFEGRATAHLLLAAQDPAGPAAARVQQALAARRRTYLQLFAAHQVDPQTATTAADLAVLTVWGRTVVLEAVADITPEQIGSLILAQLDGQPR